MKTDPAVAPKLLPNQPVRAATGKQGGEHALQEPQVAPPLRWTASDKVRQI